MENNCARKIVIRPTVEELEQKRKRCIDMIIACSIIVVAVVMSVLFILLSTNAFANDTGEVQMTSEVKVPEPIVFPNVDDVKDVQPPQNASEEDIEAQGEMVKRINELEAQEQAEADAKVAEQKQKEQEVVTTQATTTTASPSTGNSYSGSYFKKMGVINENGWRYTWYSSNRAYHYRTSEWTPDENGIYRDSSGYVVVACVADKDGNKISQGSTVPTPFGTGKVYDCGCDAGTIDVYVNF